MEKIIDEIFLDINKFLSELNDDQLYLLHNKIIEFYKTQNKINKYKIKEKIALQRYYNYSGC